MKLKNLGWNRKFETLFEPFREEGLLPARVVRSAGPDCLIRSETGDALARSSGRFLHQALSAADMPAVRRMASSKPSGCSP